MSKYDFTSFRLEDRILFEAAAAGDMAAAMTDDSSAAGDGGADPEVMELGADAQWVTVPSEVTAPANPDVQAAALVEGNIATASSIQFSEAFGAAADETLVFDPDASDQPIVVNGEVGDRRELVIITSEVRDADQIAAEFGDNVDILILNGEGSALDQINAYLDSVDGQYDAIRIFSHGNAGYLYMNGEIVDSAYVAANREAFEALGQSIAEDGDLLLYGCNLAGNDAGKALVVELAEITGADVAASIDSTGAGGNWDLEFNYGMIEAESITVDGYGYSLASAQNASELELALAGNATSITIIDSFDIGSTITVSRDVLIEGDGNDRVLTWTGAADGTMFSVGPNRTVTFFNMAFDGASSARIMSVGANSEVTLDLVIMKNGKITGAGAAVNTAAGSTLIVNGGEFSNNHASGNGGAFNIANNATLLIKGENAIFRNNSGSGGGAICGAGVGSILTISGDNTLFEGNVGNSSGYGGAIHSAGTLELSGNGTQFIANEASRGKSGSGSDTTGGGGAIYASGTVNITGSDILFEGNFGKNYTKSVDNTNGGAIWMVNKNAYLYINADGITFRNNHAENYGGAIYANYMILEDCGAIFEGNYVSATSMYLNGGGAIHIRRDIDNDHQSVIAGATFTENWVSSKSTLRTGGLGGAILVHSANVAINDCTFTRNWVANTSYGFGGAIAGGWYNIDHGGAKIAISNSTFTGNNAGYGGAISSFCESFPLIGSSAIRGASDITVANSTFTENVAVNSGGAIYNVSVSKSGVYYGGSVQIADDPNGVGTTFTGNEAKTSGGAIYHESTVELSLTGLTFSGNKTTGTSTSSTYGGAIYTNKSIDVTECVFTGNTTKGLGGAIYATGSISVNLIGTSIGIFDDIVGDAIGNSATSGGGIYLASSASLSMDAASSIAYNTATTAGGGVYVNGSALTLNVGSIHDNSVTSGNGGGIYTNAKAITLGAAFGLYGNSASGNGGGIFATGSAATVTLNGTTVGGSAANANSASNGGGVYLNSSAKLVVNNAVISHNRATNGGGIYAASGTGVTLNSARVSGNTVTGNGGGIYFAGAADLTGGTVQLNGNHATGQGGAIYAGGALTINSNTSFDDGNAGSGNSAGQGGAIFVNASLTIQGDMTFRYQSADFGGALYFVNNTTLTSATNGLCFENNSANFGGGAIYTEGDLTANGVIFTGNTSGGEGGALLVMGAFTGSALQFRGNSAVGGGGAIYGYSTLEITNSVFGKKGDATQGNRADQGGAIFGIGDLTISQTEFHGNTATQDGGAVYARSGNITVANSLFYDNSASNGRGGALFQEREIIPYRGGIGTFSTPGVFITHSEFRRNAAGTDGGALYLAGTSPIVISNSLIADGSAGGDGGGIWAQDGLHLVNVTLVKNSAANYGGIYANDVNNRMENSIVWGNTAGSTSQFDAAGFGLGVAYSAIQGWTGGGTGNIALQSAVTGKDKTGIYHVNFTDAENGDYTLNANSYLINRGNNDFNSAAKDLAGNDRVQKGTIDIGAYESGYRGNLVFDDSVQDIIYGNTDDLITYFDGLGLGGYTIVSSDTDYVIVYGDQIIAVKADGTVEVTILIEGENWVGTARTVVNTHRRDINIDINEDTYTFDGNWYTGSFTYDPNELAFEDYLTLVFEWYRNAGEYKLTGDSLQILDKFDQDVLANYNVKVTDGLLTILKGKLVIIRDADDKVYDGSADTTYQWSIEGDVNGDFYYKGGSAQYGDANVGVNKDVHHWEYTIGGDDAGNYDIEFVDIGGDITKRSITVEADSHVKYVGEPDPNYTWQIVDGKLVKGDQLYGDLYCNKTGDFAGLYIISQGTLDNSNYDITFIDGTLLVMEKGTEGPDPEDPDPEIPGPPEMHEPQVFQAFMAPEERFRVVKTFEINRRLIDPNPRYAEVTHGILGEFFNPEPHDVEHIIGLFEPGFRYSLEKAVNFKDSLDQALEEMVVVEY